MDIDRVGTVDTHQRGRRTHDLDRDGHGHRRVLRHRGLVGRRAGACCTCATTAAITAPGAALAGGVSVSDTGSFPPGSSDATTSESVSQVAGEPGDDVDA